MCDGYRAIVNQLDILVESVNCTQSVEKKKKKLKDKKIGVSADKAGGATVGIVSIADTHTDTE